MIVAVIAVLAYLYYASTITIRGQNVKRSWRVK